MRRLAAGPYLNRDPFLVGFAAETQNLEAHARAKLERKKVDLIAANRVGGGEGFDACENEILLLSREGTERLARADKLALARQLVVRIAEKYAAMRTAPVTRKPDARKAAKKAPRRR